MTTLTLVLFLVLLPLCLFLIGLILLQGGAGDISSAFGGGGQLDSTLGVGAGRKMSKITGWLAGLFMAIVLVLSVQHAGDFGKAAGAKPATLPKDDGTKAPVAPPALSDPAVKVPTTPAAPAVVPAPEGAAAPAATAPVAPAAPVIEQPAAPAVAVPAAAAPTITAPAAPVAAPADSAAPAAAVEQPAAAPAAPRSGITLDEPKK